MDDSFVITKGGNSKRKWYYIQVCHNKDLKCVVDYFNLSDPTEKKQAIELYQRLSTGESFGVRIDGYAVFVHPCVSSKFRIYNYSETDFQALIEKMALYFDEQIMCPHPYLFFDSKADDHFFEDEIKNLLTKQSEPKEKHYITLKKPERTILNGVDYKFVYTSSFERNINFFLIAAWNKEKRIVSASSKFYYNDSLSDRKRAKRLVDSFNNGKKLVAKVDRHQIFIIAYQWDNELLTDDDVLVVLNQMAAYFKENYLHDVISRSSFTDLSDEDYEEKYAERDADVKKKRKNEIMIGIIVLAIMIPIILSEYFFGIFGIIMLLAYAGDMLARR